MQILGSANKDGLEPGIRTTTSALTRADRWDHFLARWGYRRNRHTVDPGLYALGNPTPDSLVFVTANYTLSFDALRSALAGADAYILVLDTLGINVWCASGKGTFGTEELVRRIEATRLPDVVKQRTLILPQLGASGVSAHEVSGKTGFRVEFGPVRARDLPEYLKTRKATAEMRRVRFGLRDRLALIPVELVHAFLPVLVIAIALYFLFGDLSALAFLAAFLSGIVLFPVFLFWLPTKAFSSKGFILGGLTVLPFAVIAFLRSPESALWIRTAEALAFLLAFPPLTAFLTLNFTGSTPITSRTGVRREIFRYIPVMAGVFGGGLILTIALAIFV
jgi:hypothetical protein